MGGWWYHGGLRGGVGGAQEAAWTARKLQVWEASSGSAESRSLQSLISNLKLNPCLACLRSSTDCGPELRA